MKKILLSVVCLVMVGMQSMKAQTPAAIMLMHQGKATMYSNQELTNAVAAAEAGDTIFLSNGTYSVMSGLTIDKPISLIGAGQTTVVSGDVTIAIDSTATITGRLLDGIKFTHSVIFNQSPGGVIIRKCYIPINLWIGANSGSVQADRCYFRYFNNKESFHHNFSAQNCVISQLCTSETEYSGNIMFTNCNIGDFEGADYKIKATFVNCIVRINGEIYNHSSYINSAHNKVNESNYGTFSNCYSASYSFSSDYGDGFPSFGEGFSAVNLQSAGYLGTDGTIIGAEGGSTPYNLTPSLPTVSQSSFSVDNSTRTLNVTLTVTAE